MQILIQVKEKHGFRILRGCNYRQADRTFYAADLEYRTAFRGIRVVRLTGNTA